MIFWHAFCTIYSVGACLQVTENILIIIFKSNNHEKDN